MPTNSCGGLGDRFGWLLRRRPFRPGAAVHSPLHRHLTFFSLVSLGVGAVVGAGIFVLTGQAAARYAGPALSISFVLSSFACFFAGLCYAELSSSMVGVGSAYLYVYTLLGELPAFFVAQCISLEYAVSGAAVAVGFSAAVQAVLADFNTGIPAVFSQSPLAVASGLELFTKTVDVTTPPGVAAGSVQTQQTIQYQLDPGTVYFSGAYFDLIAAWLMIFLTAVICVGVKESAWVNHLAVGLKFIVLGAFLTYFVYFYSQHPDIVNSNWTPFIPPNTSGRFGEYGVSGILRGAGAIFFAYIGFDSLCQLTGECVRPKRDLPRAMLAVVLICTTLYITVTLALTGMAKYSALNVAAPVLEALRIVGAPWILRVLVDVGSIAGLFSVCLVSIMAQPRLLLALARDGLLPPAFGEVHPEYKTAVLSSLVSGGLSAIMAAFFPLDLLGELISFGTLCAFILVAVCVLVKRQREKEIAEAEAYRQGCALGTMAPSGAPVVVVAGLRKSPRADVVPTATTSNKDDASNDLAFMIPFHPVVPILTIIVCLLQIVALPSTTWRNCVVWVSVSLPVYFLRRNKDSVVVAADAEHVEGGRDEEDGCTVVNGGGVVNVIGMEAWTEDIEGPDGGAVVVDSAKGRDGVRLRSTSGSSQVSEGGERRMEPSPRGTTTGGSAYGTFPERDAGAVKVD